MESAAEFLATGRKFQLGVLETEKPHPLTMNLSEMSQSRLSEAIRLLAQIDCEALEKLKGRIPQILQLRESLTETFQNKGRVFLCGCGATGRLSLLLEVLHRELRSDERVVAFMAGGDVALVHSLEGFEDYPEYGERHLKELGFTKKDLLIAVTEGGETPYVIGAVEAASRISSQTPYFLYCNPDEILKTHVERSRRVIENQKIRKINLTVGPMALAGSTRMQASTVLQLAIGFALLADLSETGIRDRLSLMQKYLRDNADVFLLPFIEKEAAEYAAGRYILYHVRDYPITVFTDTTERAPTFSLTPFSHREAKRLLALQPSKSYIYLNGEKTAPEAWQRLLQRAPRPLNWLDIDSRTSSAYLEEFDFSMGAIEFRKWLTSNAEHSEFAIRREGQNLLWSLHGEEHSLMWPQPRDLLFEHTVLKMFLNIHSTLIMGRLGRYKRNLMTWVYPTNGKLIDRATRYVQTLLREDGITISYEQVVEALFDQKKKVTGNQSLVLATYEELRG